MSKRKMQKELFEAARLQAYEEAVLKRRAAERGDPGDAAGLEGEQRGVLPFVFRPEKGLGDVTGRAGLPLVVEAFRAHGGEALVGEHLSLKQRARGCSEQALVEGFCLLQASGGEHLEDFAVLREDVGLSRLLSFELPSPDAARRFLVHFHDQKLIEAARVAAEAAGEKSYVPEENDALLGLGAVQRGQMQRIADVGLGTKATLDHDATIIESQKQTATWHYQGGTGYQPAAVYWSEQDLVVADEFRDGNVPAGKDNLRLIQRAFQSLPGWVKELYFRADSACYEERVLKWLANPRREGGPAGLIGFTVSADMTVDLRKVCEQVLEPEGAGESEQPRWQLLDDTRADERVEWAEVEFVPGDWPKATEPLRYLAVRILRRQGKLFATGERYKYLGVVSNRKESGCEVIRWHWGKAGTIEHVHDETKNGLGAGVLPCAEFGANAAWYRLALITYNLMTSIKRQVLPPEERRSKAKRVRFLVFELAARITQHARMLLAHIEEKVLRRAPLPAGRAVYRRLYQMQMLPVPGG